MFSFLTVTKSVARRAYSTAADGPLIGTALRYNSYLFLHSPSPPGTFESKHSTTVQRQLQLHIGKWGGYVNFSHGIGPILEGGEDKYAATAYTRSGIVRIPEINLANVEEISDKLRDSAFKHTNDEVHLYVCTHGARDCRCGTKGGALFTALQEEVAKRDVGAKVKVAETGHVGGHQYAGNLLVYPFGEWLGLLEAKHAPAVLDAVLSAPNVFRQATIEDPPLLAEHWRGRPQYNKPEQLELYEYHCRGGPRPSFQS